MVQRTDEAPWWAPGILQLCVLAAETRNFHFGSLCCTLWVPLCPSTCNMQEIVKHAGECGMQEILAQLCALQLLHDRVIVCMDRAATCTVRGGGWCEPGCVVMPGMCVQLHRAHQVAGVFSPKQSRGVDVIQESIIVEYRVSIGPLRLFLASPERVGNDACGPL